MARNYLMIIFIFLFLVGCSTPPTERQPTPHSTMGADSAEDQEIQDIIEPIQEHPTQESPIPVPEEEPLDIEEPEAVQLKPKEQKAKEQNIATIEITDKFTPTDTTISAGTTMVWVNEDGRPHLIACYEKVDRFYVGHKLEERGASSKHTFDKEGEFLCIDSIYGLRGNIKVNPKSSAITGYAVFQGNTASKDNYTALFLLIGSILLISHIAVKKKHFKF